MWLQWRACCSTPRDQVTGVSVELVHVAVSRIHLSVTSPNTSYKRKKKPDRTSRQTQAGIGHNAPAHRGGHVQNRIRRRQVRRGKIEHSAEAEQPRTDGGPGRQGEACQHGRVRGPAGAHCNRHPKKERCNKIQTLKRNVPRGHTAQLGQLQGRAGTDNTSRGSNNGGMTGPRSYHP